MHNELLQLAQYQQAPGSDGNVLFLLIALTWYLFLPLLVFYLAFRFLRRIVRSFARSNETARLEAEARYYERYDKRRPRDDPELLEQIKQLKEQVSRLQSELRPGDDEVIYAPPPPPSGSSVGAQSRNYQQQTSSTNPPQTPSNARPVNPGMQSSNSRPSGLPRIPLRTQSDRETEEMLRQIKKGAR